MPKIALLRLALALLAVACSPARHAPLTTADVVAILRIEAWHLPIPEDGAKQWTIDVEQISASPTPGARASAVLRYKATALIAVRPQANDNYEFALRQNRGQSAGTLRLCAEPRGSDSLCQDGYSISFEAEPRCLGDCSKVLLATLTPMLGERVTKVLVATLEPTLVITPPQGDVVVPLP